MVHIDHQHAQRPLVPEGTGAGLGQPVVEADPVGDLHQAIGA